MSRSGSPYSVPRDANHVPFLVAASTTDGITPVVLEADPSTHLLQVSSSGGGGGTQYQELATTTPATGTLALGRYQSSLPTLTTGQMNEPMLDSSSRLIESNSATIATNTGNSATSANQTNGNQQTKITDGTSTAGVLSPGTANSTGNALLSAMTTQSVSFSSSITTGTANLASTDAGNYNIVAVQLFQLGTGGASIAFQGSNDNTNWYSVPVNRNSVTLSTPFTSTTAADMYTGAIPFRYFRLQLSGQTGGTTSGVVTFKTGNYSPMTIAGQIAINGTQAISGNVGSANATGSAVPANAFYIGVGSGGNLSGVTAPTADALSPTAGIGSFNMSYNGTNWDRVRTANTASGTTGTGLLGVGVMVGGGGGNYFNMGSANGAGDANSASSIGGIVANYNWLYNGTTWDRTRSATTASNTTGTGLLGVGLLEWDGTNYQRVPAARFSPASTKLNTYAVKITTNTTTTPTAATAYVSSISISADATGTTSTITIQDKSGTPLKIVNGLSTTALTTTPTIVNFQTPILATGGIDIITTGAVAATVDVFLNYYQ